APRLPRALQVAVQQGAQPLGRPGGQVPPSGLRGPGKSRIALLELESGVACGWKVVPVKPPRLSAPLPLESDKPGVPFGFSEVVLLDAPLPGIMDRAPVDRVV